MAELAIKGHPTRGKEVIEILEMLGGKNLNNLDGASNMYYLIGLIVPTILAAGKLELDKSYEQFTYFTLEEFLEKFPYKVGDKVFFGDINYIVWEIESMQWMSNEIKYIIKDNNKSRLCDIKAEHLKPYKEETMEEKGTLVQIDFTRELRIADEIEVILGDYEFVLKDGKTYFVKKKPQYPKTYKECCDVLGIDTMDNDAKGYKHFLVIQFQELLIARDAYWKMAGEQMGLDKPWEHDWNWREHKFCIGIIYAKIEKFNVGSQNHILSFPTEEMRDAFYDNFKELIEQCKEIL